jgi:Holliday junction resolvase RusA-like endonuclease
MHFVCITNSRPTPKGSGTRTRNGGYIEAGGVGLKKYMASLILEMRDQWEPDRLDGPVRCQITFTFPLAKGKSGVLFADKVRRGDLDKLVRAVLDAATQAGVWNDDKQVCEIHAAVIAASRETVGDGVTLFGAERMDTNVEASLQM